MTVPSLLSHFGMDVARFVSTSGRVIFDGVARSPVGAYSHPEHGLVTAVAKHTFHGGAVPPDKGAQAGGVWWDDPEQIGRHITAMREAFPSFAYLPPTEDATPCWWGEIDTGRGRFKIAIFLRRDGGLPFVSVLSPRLGVQSGRKWTLPPHLYLDGRICVAGADDWHIDEHTAATVAAWAAHWLAAYTEWRFRRQWPTEGVHETAA